VSSLHRLLVAALAAGALTFGGAVAHGAALPPAGDPAGIELAKKANRYYSAPARMGVEIRAPLEDGVMRQRFVLAHGRTQAVITSIASGDERESLLDSARGFFAREHGKRCWVRRGAGRHRGNTPLINLSGSTFFPPERIGGLTTLEVRERVRGTNRHLSVAYRIDAETGRIATQTIGGDLLVAFRTLSAPPVVPVPTPRCSV
jgi:hypothetical protein